MPKEYLIFALFLFDLLILIVLVLLYWKIKRFLSLPWEEIEESILKAQELVDKLKDLKKGKGISDAALTRDPTEEVLLLFQKGLKPKEIAKQLGLSLGEVEVILKKKKIIS